MVNLRFENGQFIAVFAFNRDDQEHRKKRRI